MSRLKDAIKSLHARKDRSYRGAWKRRGERISVLPNIARKVDRLEVFAQEGTELSDEHIFDTALDLYVYSLKYLLLLGEQDPSIERQLSLHEALSPLSDHASNFDQLIDQGNVEPDSSAMFGTIVDRICHLFEKLWRAADAGAPLARRFDMALELSNMAGSLVVLVAADYPEAAGTFEQNELGAMSRN